MKKLFFIGAFLLIIFEIVRVYFIMPFPFSQGLNSVQGAYFVHQYRWAFRVIFLFMMFVGFVTFISSKRKWLYILVLLLTGAVVYATNFIMSADSMFKKIRTKKFATLNENKIELNALVLVVQNAVQAKAYPIRLLAYHHQINDTVGGKPILVTYCNVCRTGRCYDPVIDTVAGNFRLVGMTYFNAMLEDAITKSWWQQADGKCVAGKLKGRQLKEINCTQTTLQHFYEQYPHGVCLQMDTTFLKNYDNGKYERGESTGELTGTNHESWQTKSWVVGVKYNGVIKAYDWNTISKNAITYDTLNNIPIILAVNKQQFLVFENTLKQKATARNDTIFYDNNYYNYFGENLNDKTKKLTTIPSYQEFWHSWKTFQPSTMK